MSFSVFNKEDISVSHRWFFLWKSASHRDSPHKRACNDKGFPVPLHLCMYEQGSFSTMRRVSTYTYTEIRKPCESRSGLGSIPFFNSIPIPIPLFSIPISIPLLPINFNSNSNFNSGHFNSDSNSNSGEFKSNLNSGMTCSYVWCLRQNWLWLW